MQAHNKNKHDHHHGASSSLNDKVILAPMVGGSELAFRKLVRNHGVTTACYTPMLRSQQVVQAFDLWQQQLQQNDNLSWTENLHEDGVLLLHDIMMDTEPLVVQICGSSPKVLYQATRALLQLNRHSSNTENVPNSEQALPCQCKIVGIDLNLGCPQSTARNAHFGAFLAEGSPDLALECIAAMRRAIDDELEYENNGSPPDSENAPFHSQQQEEQPKHQMSTTTRRPRLSCKIRLRDDLEDTLRFVHNLEKAGCDVIAVHCRRRDEKHLGLPDYETGAAIVQASNIPIVMNGDGFSKGEIQSILDVTKAPAVMVGRGFLSNPFLLCPNGGGANDEDDVEDKGTATTAATSRRNPALLAASYLDFAEQCPPPSPMYIRNHLRWIFRDDIKPDFKNPIEFKTDWRARLWTFLARPYLETIHQFRQVVALFVQQELKESSKSSGREAYTQHLPHSITKLSKEVTFHDIRHNKNEIVETVAEEDTQDHGGLALGLFG